MKNASSKKPSERQRTWDMARDLLRKSFKNISHMGGVKRDIDIRSMLNDLKHVESSLESARQDLVPQYRTAKNKPRSEEAAHSPIESPSVPEPKPEIRTTRVPAPPSEPEDPEDLNISLSAAKPGTIGANKNPETDDYYSEEDTLHRLGVPMKTLNSLIKGNLDHDNPFGVKLNVDIKKNKGQRYYSKKDIEHFIKFGLNAAGRFPWPMAQTLPEKPAPEPEKAPQEMPPEEPTKPAAEKVPDQEPVKEPELTTGPVKPEPVPEPEQDQDSSHTPEEAFEKAVTDPALHKNLERTGAVAGPVWDQWVTGNDRMSSNPWLFYLALRGSGDKPVKGAALTARLKDIFTQANSSAKNNPWSLLQAYDKIRKYGANYNLADGPDPKEIAEMIAHNPPKEIENLSRRGGFVKDRFIGRPQLTKEVEQIRNWLNKIPYPDIRSMASGVILSMVPDVLGRYFQGKL